MHYILLRKHPPRNSRTLVDGRFRDSIDVHRWVILLERRLWDGVGRRGFQPLCCPFASERLDDVALAKAESSGLGRVGEIEIVVGAGVDDAAVPFVRRVAGERVEGAALTEAGLFISNNYVSSVKVNFIHSFCYERQNINWSKSIKEMLWYHILEQTYLIILKIQILHSTALKTNFNDK